MLFIVAMVLLALIGHNRYQVRYCTTQHLQSNMAQAQPWLLAIEHVQDVESYTRIAKLLNAVAYQQAHHRSYYVLPTAKVLHTTEEPSPCSPGKARHPWISSNPLKYNLLGDWLEWWWYEVVYYYLNQAPKNIGVEALHDENYYDGPDWLRYREATRLMVVDLLRRRVPTGTIQALLNIMAHLDAVWWARYVPVYTYSYKVP